MLDVVQLAVRLRDSGRAAVALREHARLCSRCARADRRSLHANAYCPEGRAWLFRWRHAARAVRER